MDVRAIKFGIATYNIHMSKLALTPIDPTWSETLWDLFGTDLDGLPKTWPKNKSDFQKWLVTTKDLPRRYVVIVDNEVAALVSCDLVDDDNQRLYPLAEFGDVNLSYSTLKKFSGRGVATFAVTETTRILLNDGHKPVLRIASFNTGSIRVAEKTGFVKVHSDIISTGPIDDDPKILDVYRLKDA
jgi:RimJ/RimL family protein N-acetyltransferase